MAESINSIHWFRKGLRLHDNPALLLAVKDCQRFWAIFILDPWIAKNTKVGVNRWRFLVESLSDLDKNLRKVNSRLFVLRGNPTDVFPSVIKKWKIKLLTYEYDSEPYARSRDERIENIAKEMGVEVLTKVSNTLYNPERIIQHNGKPPLSYKSFVGVTEQLGHPAKPVETLTELKEFYNWICKFEKPNTEPNTITPSTTVLSPYVKFGCLSIRTFYYKIKEIYDQSKAKYSKPPVSLHGQLFWREFFYTVGSSVPNFDKMVGNPVCCQIPWSDNPEFLEAWTNAKTGYPFIDAIMTQLRQEGWIHHLARHAVACFLTRGDLWVSWEHGMKVFEELLLDADWSLNAGNWMWLSASAFFHQFFRVYSPIAFGKKTDKEGLYIKKYVPILRKFPSEYIYEPWKAPIKLQHQLNCVIGKDYPFPIVDHDQVRAKNIKLMSQSYKNNKQTGESSKASSSKPKSPAKRTGSKESTENALGFKRIKK